MVQVKDQLAKNAQSNSAEEGLMIGPSGGAAIQRLYSKYAKEFKTY